MGWDTPQAPTAEFDEGFVKVVNTTAQELRSWLDMLGIGPDAGVEAID